MLVKFSPVVVLDAGDLFALEPEARGPEPEVGPQAAAVLPVAVGLLPIGVVEIALPVSLCRPRLNLDCYPLIENSNVLREIQC